MGAQILTSISVCNYDIKKKFHPNPQAVEILSQKWAFQHKFQAHVARWETPVMKRIQARRWNLFKIFLPL